MDQPLALRHRNLLYAALGDLIRRSVRSIVITLCLAAILFPLVTALAISEGLRFQAEIAVEEGADFYISDDLYGGNGPISLAYLEEFSALKGVSRATARVVGRAYIANRIVAVVGLDKGALIALKPIVRGEIPHVPGEVVVGQGIVDEFDIKQGTRFTLPLNKRKVFKLTGNLSSSCLWCSDIMIMSHRDANEFFRIKGYTTQLLIYGSSRSGPGVKNPLSDRNNPLITRSAHFMIEERNQISESLRSGYDHKGGIFIVLYIIGAALTIPAFLVTSGFGLRELDWEFGVLKAVGWRTREVLEKVALENLLISLTAVSLSILLSMAWIKGLNGILIAQFYIAEVGLVPGVDIPSRYLPSHGLFCLVFTLSVTLLGGLLPAWKKAVASPGELMR